MSRSQDNWVAMGYVKGAFGIKGWVKVAADTEYADSLLDYPVWRFPQLYAGKRPGSRRRIAGKICRNQRP